MSKHRIKNIAFHLSLTMFLIFICLGSSMAANETPDYICNQNEKYLLYKPWTLL
jgi:hypothetical protein